VSGQPKTHLIKDAARTLCGRAIRGALRSRVTADVRMIDCRPCITSHRTAVENGRPS
jgi:hypothetical protein